MNNKKRIRRNKIITISNQSTLYFLCYNHNFPLMIIINGSDKMIYEIPRDKSLVTFHNAFSRDR